MIPFFKPNALKISLTILLLVIAISSFFAAWEYEFFEYVMWILAFPFALSFSESTSVIILSVFVEVIYLFLLSCVVDYLIGLIKKVRH